MRIKNVFDVLVLAVTISGLSACAGQTESDEWNLEQHQTMADHQNVGEENLGQSTEALTVRRAPGGLRSAIGGGMIGGTIDLTVSNFVILAPPTIGCGWQNISYSAVETNLGTAPSGSYWLHLYYDAGQGGLPNYPVSSNQRPSLGGGATRAITGTFGYWNGPCDCGGGNYTLQFRLKTDAPNQINETNEANNFSNIQSKSAHCP